MKKTINVLLASFLFAGLLTGCSMNNNDSGKENKTDTGAVKNDVKNDMDESIDNVMNFFKTKKVDMQNTQPIKNMEFAAYEGKSFDFNGKTAYLYRVKSEDESMKKVLKEAKEKGKVRVNIKNKEMEYGAKVNGNFLLLYDPAADMNDVLTTFGGYTSNMNNMSNTNGMGNTNTNTSDASRNSGTNDPTTGNVTNGNQNPDSNTSNNNATNNMNEKED